MAIEQINLINGPSKFDLMDALFGAANGVEFVREGGHTFRAHISGVEKEDGSRDSWLIVGFARPKEVGVTVTSDAEYNNTLQRFTGYLSTQRRSGHIRFNAPGT